MPPARGRQRGRGRVRAARDRSNPVNVNNQEQEAGRTRGACQRSRSSAPQPARPPRRRRRITEVPDNEPPVLHRRTPESSSPSSSDDKRGPQTPRPTVPPPDEVHARLDHLNACLDSIIPLLGTQPPLQHSSLGTSQGLLTQTAGVPAAAAGAPTMDPVHQMIVQGATVQPGWTSSHQSSLARSNTSTSAPSLPALVNTASTLLAASVAPSTARQYQQVWESF